MRLFRYWTRPECVDAIKALEEGVASGAQSIQYPSGGGMAFTTLDNASRILAHLYRRVDELDGTRSKSEVRYIRMIPKRGW